MYVRESEDLMDEIKSLAKEELDNCDRDNIREWSTIKSNLRDSLTRYVYSKTKRQPMILPILMDVDMNKNRD